MRIAFVSHSRRKVGGAEVYLDSVISAFEAAGHDIAFLYETDRPSERAPIAFSSTAPAWCVGADGITVTLRHLQLWKPDILFTHGLLDPELEAAVVAIAPSVLYVHSYYGTCISGDKLHRAATPHVCERRFGPACLLHYFPQRCGGRNPLTMLSRFRLQSRRLELMRRYSALVTNSQHMVRELKRHQLDGECVYPFVGGRPDIANLRPQFTDDPLRLIFAGRMSPLKGGDYLLNAAPEAQRRLARKLHITFAGDGPSRPEWERAAAQLQNERLAFDFPGWLSASELQCAIAKSHLLVFPSIWPEPFGLSGLEAALFGVPTVAFAVGGIPEWLNDGVNGHLAPAPPSPTALAEAIAKALSNKDHFEQLRSGACREARQYHIDDHIAQLTRIFERCAA